MGCSSNTTVFLNIVTARLKLTLLWHALFEENASKHFQILEKLVSPNIYHIFSTAIMYWQVLNFVTDSIPSTAGLASGYSSYDC